jgi:2-haloacid dehalogenase
MVKGVLFDLDDTLLDFTLSQRDSLKDVLLSIGLRPEQDLFFATFQRINSELWDDFQSGRVTKEFLRVERFTRFTNHFSIEADPLVLASLFVEKLSQSVHEIKGATQLCEKLKNNGIEIAIVTNGFKKVQESRILKSGLHRFIRTLVVSEEVGFAKPHPKIFEIALNRLGLKAHEVLVVGDRLDADIQGAKNIGAKSCLFKHGFFDSGAAKPSASSPNPDFESTNLDEIWDFVCIA